MKMDSVLNCELLGELCRSLDEHLATGRYEEARKLARRLREVTSRPIWNTERILGMEPRPWGGLPALHTNN